MNPITYFRLLLTVDYVCWIGATIAFVWFEYPTIAALVGATGIMYLWRATMRFRELKRSLDQADRAMAALIHFIETGENDDPNTVIKKFDSEEEFAEWLTKGDKDDDWPNP